MKWTRDFGLTMRMLFTSFLLLIVYLIFLGILAALGFSFGFLLFAAAAMAFLQFFFSDKLVLWSTGTVLSERMSTGAAPDDRTSRHESRPT